MDENRFLRARLAMVEEALTEFVLDHVSRHYAKGKCRICDYGEDLRGTLQRWHPDMEKMARGVLPETLLRKGSEEISNVGNGPEEECLRCKGVGKILVLLTSSDSAYRECPSCGGTGRIVIPTQTQRGE